MTVCLPCRRNQNASNPLTVELHSSISTVEGDEWDRIVNGRSLFLGRDYLAAVESSRIPFCHAVFREEKQAVGAASFQAASFAGAPLESLLSGECSILALVARPIKIIKNPFASTFAVCGSLLVSGEHGYVFSQHVTPEAAGTALVEASKKAKIELDKKVPTSGVLFKEFYPGSKPLVRALGKCCFSELETDPSMVLPIDANWRDFEDYLKSLSSKYRVKANRTYMKSKDLKERDLLSEDLLLYKERLAYLYASVAKRARFRLGGLDMDTLFQLRSRLGNEFILRGYFLGLQLVGFLMGFVNGDTLEAGLVGFDYELNNQHAVYPRMLYDYLKSAVERRLKRVNYGRTASEIKSTLGAVPVQMSCCLNLEKRALNTVLQMFLGTVHPQPITLRKPFKKNWYDLNEAAMMRSVSPASAVQPQDRVY